ncbi:hypothetical protein D3C87_1557970 [compost metagenome]
MKKRNLFAVLLLCLFTFGVYSIVWPVKTKIEMNRLGANIPTAWLIIIPIVNIYWLWKYSEGVEQVTNGKQSAALAFILLFLLGVIGYMVIQNEFNKLADAPVQPVQPANEPVFQPIQ